MPKKGNRKRVVKTKQIVRQGNVCRVVPGHVSIKQQLDSVCWHATNTNATIWFPTGQPFGWTTRTVKRGARVTSGLARKEGTFPYAVYCDSGKLYAVGNSDPEIIVKR